MRGCPSQACHCKTAGVAATAAAIRDRLPTSVPSRLLLSPLLGYWDAALADGEAAACQLLALVGNLLSGGDAKSAAAAAEPVFMFLLRALDTRQAAPEGWSAAGAWNEKS